MIQNLEERIQSIQIPSSKPDPFETLTKIEFNVLEFLIKGRSNLEIAETQHISKHTVRAHLRNIYSKAGIPGKNPHDKCGKATILYMIYHPRSFLDSYTKKELENVKLIDDLTPRQRGVLECYVLNFSHKKIADKLKVSKNTVKTHLFNIAHKLHFERIGSYRKNINALRLYVLRYPEMIPSLYSQVKHLTANNDKNLFKKRIDTESILSNVMLNQDLTPRELETLYELIKGGSNEEIAYRLFIDEATIRSHIKRINKKWKIKLNSAGNHEAIRTARQQIYTKTLERYRYMKALDSILIPRK